MFVVKVFDPDVEDFQSGVLELIPAQVGVRPQLVPKISEATFILSLLFPTRDHHSPCPGSDPLQRIEGSLEAALFDVWRD